MGEVTKIEWCHHTFNPWFGCAKVAPECKNCYAEELMSKRFRGKDRLHSSRESARTGGQLPAEEYAGEIHRSGSVVFVRDSFR